MVQIIAGTVNNAVKLDVLAKNWEQKKNSNYVFSKKNRNERVNMSPEQRQIEQFKEELAHNREQNRNNEIANKIMNGEDLTLDEEQYLARNNPGLLSSYRCAKAERQEYEEKLQKCKTKDEVQRLKINTMNAYLAQLKAAPGEAKAAKAMEILGKVRNIQKAELHFIKSGGYAQLPTEAEILKESADDVDENTEVMEEDNKEVKDTNPLEDTKNDETVIDDEKKREPKPKKKEKDPIEDIEVICRRYIPNVDGGNKTGNKIDVAM